MSSSAIEVRCGALLFDLDGVLIDSTPAVERVWRKWAIDHGFDPQEVVARAHGRPSLTTVSEYLPDADHVAENRKVEQAEIADVEGVIPLPGAVNLLASLPANRWTIVTSCTRALALVRLKAAGLSVPQTMVTSTDITRGKPHPEPYLKAAGILRLDATECVVLEDAPAGVRSGKAAGARVIGLRTMLEESALRKEGADWTVRSCADIRLAASGPDSALILRIVEQPRVIP